MRKEQDFVFFFQKGTKSDTLQKNKNDIFYLLVPDSLKEKIVFDIENGQLIKTGNDSLVKLNYLPGLKYEYKFEINTGDSGIGYKPGQTSSKIKRVGSYSTRINGTSSYPESKMRVRLQNIRTGKLVYEMIFWYKP